MSTAANPDQGVTAGQRLGLHPGPYLRLLAAGLRQQLTYRLAMFGGLVANVTFGFLKVTMLFAAVRAAGGELNGYTIGSMSAYIWISQGLLGSINLSGESAFAQRIKTGDVAVDFARPLNPQLAAISTETGMALAALGPRGLPSVAIGMVVGMTMPATPLPYLLGALSILLGIVLSASTVYAVNTLGFWLVETRGVQLLYMVASGFLAGLFIPIALFPGWLLAVAQATPFPSMMMYPIDVLTGRADIAHSVVLILIQLGWLAATLLAGQLLTWAGRRKLEVQGG